MTDSVDDLDAIRAREGAATPGPWHLRGKSVQADVQVSDDGPDDGIWNHSVVCSVGAWGSGRPTVTDAEFIAGARTDVPILLKRVNAVEAENARLWAMVGRVFELATSAEPAGGIGCLTRDPSGVCDGRCGGHRTTGWTLDPVEVLAALEGVAAKGTTS